MEVSLHRTKSILGEKVIRLRHIEKSLRRIQGGEEPKDSKTDSNLPKQREADYKVYYQIKAIIDKFNKYMLIKELYEVNLVLK